MLCFCFAKSCLETCLLKKIVDGTSQLIIVCHNVTLLMFPGSVVGEILEDVIPMMVANLKPDKDPEVRLKFFSLLSRLMMNSVATLDSQQKFGDFAVTVVREMVIPNCVWTAGRVAGAIRTTAVSCLWALLQSGVLSKDRVSSFR